MSFYLNLLCMEWRRNDDAIGTTKRNREKREKTFCINLKSIYNHDAVCVGWLMLHISISLSRYLDCSCTTKMPLLSAKNFAFSYSQLRTYLCCLKASPESSARKAGQSEFSVRLRTQRKRGKSFFRFFPFRRRLMVWGKCYL